MARLPTREDLGRRSASVSRSVARLQAPGVQTNTGVAEGLQEFGAQVTAFAAKRKKERDSTDLIRAEAQHKKALRDLDREIKADPDYGTHDQKFLKASAGATEKSASLIRDARLRERWQIQADSRNDAARDRVLTRSVTLARTAERASVIEALNTQLEAYTDPDSGDADRAQTLADINGAIAASERSGVLTVAQAKAARNKYSKGAVKADAEIRLRSDPQGLLEDIEGKDGRYAGLTNLERARVKDRATKKVKSLEKTARKEAEKLTKELSAVVLPTKSRDEIDPTAFVIKTDSLAAQGHVQFITGLTDTSVPVESAMASVEESGDRVLEGQRRIGVVDNNLKLLTIDESKQIVRRLEATQPDQAAIAFNDLKTRSGKHFPLVYQELVEQGLPQGYVLAGVASDSLTDMQAILEGVQDDALKGTAIRSGEIIAADRDLARDLIKDVTADVSDVLSAFAAGSRDRTQAEGFLDGVLEVAVNQFRRTGNYEGSRQFAANILTSRFETVDGSNERFLIPTRDVPLTSREAQTVLDSLREEDALKKFKPVLFDRSAPDPVNRARAVQGAENGIWVNNEAGDGVVLMYRFPGGGLLAVENEGGERYGISFDDMVDMLQGIAPEEAGGGA